MLKLSTLLAMLLLTCCSTNPSIENAMGYCESSIKSTFSAGDVVQFTYNIGKQDEVDILAMNWCSNRGKTAKTSSKNCNGCCSTTYRCFRE